MPASGHVVVLGTAGSGKTTLAILRAVYLADRDTDHHGPTLLLTFNNTLIVFLRSALGITVPGLTIETYHKFARGYLHSQGKLPWGSICSDDATRTNLVTTALMRARERRKGETILHRPIEFFSDELAWISRSGYGTFNAYNEAQRIGRAENRVERGNQRRAVFDVLEIYRELRAKRGMLYDWDDIATSVSNALEEDQTPRRYRHVVIDEGQDFSPEMLRSLVKTVPESGSVTFFGDVAQQIYGQRISWRSAGFIVRDVWRFQENYRNSKEIAALAVAVSKMPYYRDTPDLVEPTTPNAAGPLPTLVGFPSRDAETEFIVRQALQLGRSQSVAILVRHVRDRKAFAARIQDAILIDRGMKQWILGPGVRLATYHSAKGLEFDAVLIPYLSADRLPSQEDISAFGPEEAASREGRLLYVAITRARARLILTHSGRVTALLPEASHLYSRVES